MSDPHLNVGPTRHDKNQLTRQIATAMAEGMDARHVARVTAHLLAPPA